MAGRRSLFLVASLASGALVLVLLAGFVWPDEPFPNHPDSMNLGPIEQYEVGSVTRILPPGDYDDTRWPNARTQIAGDRAHHAGMWLVRLDDGSVRVLLARGPRQGCTVPWRETFVYEGEAGWFRNPCQASTYTKDGRWVQGVSTRDMDWLAVSIERDGDIVVDLTTLHPGETHGGIPADERALPTVEGWSVQ